MNRAPVFLFKLSIVFISIFLIDGGRTFFIAGSNIHNIVMHHHANDLEIPDLHNFNSVLDNEEWIESDYQKIVVIPDFSESILYSPRLTTLDFISSIWQPPKFE